MRIPEQNEHRFRPTDVLIGVSNTGVGMTPEQSEHIFERFYRADPARSRQTASFGLAIAREVLRAHHGSVEVVSQPGQGTAFRLRLPAAPPGTTERNR